MQKVLVTGANGFVGRHVVSELQGNLVETVGVGGPEGTNSSGASEFVALDLTQADEAAKLDFKDISGVIHLAGLAAIGPSFDNPDLYIKTNVGIEENLFEAALKQNVRPRFLIISTGALYDPSADLPLTEESPVKSSSPYAESKIGQENRAYEYAKRGFEIIIARPFNHIGPGQGPGFIVPDIAQQIVECEQGKRQEVLVGNLEAKRDYTDVRDIVRAYRLLLDSGSPGEVYNVCSGQARSGHEILEGLGKAAGFEPHVKSDPAKMRPSDNPVIYGDHNKLTAVTGWQPEIPLEKTLADVMADWRSRL